MRQLPVPASVHEFSFRARHRTPWFGRGAAVRTTPTPATDRSIALLFLPANTLALLFAALQPRRPRATSDPTLPSLPFPRGQYSLDCIWLTYSGSPADQTTKHSHWS